jgi:hypothetical protein
MATLGFTAAKFVFLALSASHEPPGAFGFRGMTALSPLAFGIIGFLITTRTPRNTIGWIFAFNGLLYAVLAFSEDYAAYAVLARPGLAGGEAAAWLLDWLWIPVTGFTAASLLIFPDGRLLSRPWKLAVALSLAAVFLTSMSIALSPGLMETYPDIDNPYAVRSTAGLLEVTEIVGFLFLFATTTVAAASLIVRYRRSEPDVRTQIKWILVAGCLAAATFGLGGTGNAFLESITFVGLISIPAAIGISILKYRLYSIDIVIRRGLVYVPLSAILAGLYIAGIGVFKTIFTDLTGSESDAAVAFTTLVVVALFSPIKDKLQFIVNKHFSDSTSSRQRLVKFEQELRPVVLASNPHTLLSRFLDEAVAGLEARGGSVRLSNGSVPHLVLEKGVLNTDPGLVIPLTRNGSSIGSLYLGERRGGQRYSQEDLDLLRRSASLVASALAPSLDQAKTTPG